MVMWFKKLISRFGSVFDAFCKGKPIICGGVFGGLSYINDGVFLRKWLAANRRKLFT